LQTLQIHFGKLATWCRLDCVSEATYYLSVFGYQRKINLPQYSHTFATFIEADKEKNIKSHTISWMPKTFSVRLVCTAEKGFNLSLQDSLKLGLRVDAQLSHWGPYRIEKELFNRAKKQIESLNSGKILYKAIDLGHRPNRASNCIHAVSDIDTDEKKLISGIRYGISASRLVARHLKRWIINSDETHSWVGEKLNLGNYPITHLKI